MRYVGLSGEEVVHRNRKAGKLKFNNIAMKKIICMLFALAMLGSCTEKETVIGFRPANPNATKEARQLLEFLYSIQGKYTLTGQHNFVSDLDRYDSVVYAMTGREYQRVHKQRVSALAPIIDLTPPEISSGSEEFMIVMDRFAVRNMKGQLIKIVGKDGFIKEQRVTGVRHFHIKPNYIEEENDYDNQG